MLQVEEGGVGGEEDGYNGSCRGRGRDDGGGGGRGVEEEEEEEGRKKRWELRNDR